MKVIILISVLFFALVWSEKQPRLADFDKIRVDTNPKKLAIVRNLHVNWFAHSIKALMVQLGKDLYSKLPVDQKQRFANCLDKIEEKKDLVSSAKCLIAAKKRFEISDPIFETKPIKLPGFVQDFPANQKGQNWTKNSRVFLRKRFGGVKRFKFDEKRRFQRRWKRSTFEALLKSQFQSRNEKAHAHPWKIRNVKTLERLSIGQRTPVGKVANLIRQFTDETSRETNGKKWSGTYKRLLNLRDEMHEKESKPGSRVYDFRMYDLVLDHEKPTLGPKARRTPQGLVEMALQMINSRNASFRNTEQNTKILSPRLAPLMPDKAPAKDEILSPTVFALYDDDKHNKSIASIPSILKATGIGKSDRESIVDLIMSLSKTTKVVEETLDFLNNMNFVGVEKPIMTATEKIAKSFDGISESLTAQQRLEMDRKGFTFMEKHQMQQLYRDESFNFPEEALDFDDYHKLRPHEREEALWSRIERIAINLPDEHPRVKRQFKTLSVLAPTILAPYMFSPVYGFTVLGPTILSPNIFSPLILNPAVLSPYILSPAVAMPFILSPYLLSPYILTPIVMAPFIINPYVLSPNVLNPYILSPIILSPLVLSPDVLSPQVLGGAILSPSVASPAVLTESVLMGNVLSPTFLS